MNGRGEFEIGERTCLGVYPSPGFDRGEFYLEARHSSACIKIGKDVIFNNNCIIIADKSSIVIGDHTLIGPNFICFDSSFHSLNPKKRLSGSYSCKSVNIGNNVFIGEGVKILKGVVIGDNSVVAAGVVVNFDVPANSIVGVNGNIYPLIENNLLG